MTDPHHDPRAARRRFLRCGGQLAAAGALALGPLGRLLAQAGDAAVRRPHSGFGPIRPVRDLATGMPLLALPEGFSYISFGWAGEPMAGGQQTPGNHDGMGIVRTDGDVLTLVRNHEVSSAWGSFAPAAGTYDKDAAGGTVTLRFDANAGKALDARPSLSGTLVNCAGGVTPWNTWLSCEEIVLKGGQEIRLADGNYRKLARDHGFVFEVPADGLSEAEPLVAMGQFRHEAATIDPRSGIAYLTEDEEPVAGFYRFIPKERGALARGGRLQMLKAAGAPDLRSGHRAGARFRAQWVEIEHPERGIDSGGPLGVLRQGLAGGGSKFTRLEGCIAAREAVYFTATNGGDEACGQVWAYRPEREELELVYESPDQATLHYPDNIVPSPRGGLLICQDSPTLPTQHLYGLTAGGELFTFARNAVNLDGSKGFAGDYSDAEWAGSCFSPDGRWLFANVYSPGFTVAITGPWKQGLI